MTERARRVLWSVAVALFAGAALLLGVLPPRPEYLLTVVGVMVVLLASIVYLGRAP